MMNHKHKLHEQYIPVIVSVDHLPNSVNRRVHTVFVCSFSG
jgi:hypothetical protein